MLEDIREKKTNRITYALVIIAGIGMLFIGVPLFNQRGNEASIATINGQNIPLYYYNEAYRNIQRQDRDLPQSETQQRALRRVIEQALFQQHALKSRYILPDSSLYRIIKNQFSGNEQYTKWLAANGMRAETYQNSVRSEQTVATYYRALQINLGEGNPLLQNHLQALAQERGYTLYTIPRAPLADSVSVSDDALQTYYQEHGGNYLTPETVDISYTLYDIADLGVNDEQIATARRASEKRGGRYIIFDEGKAAAEAAATTIKTGEKTFAYYWQAISDKTIAGETGILDPASKDKSVTPEIGEALFALANTGDISPVIHSEYGDILIELGSIEAGAQGDEELRRLAALQNIDTYTRLANQALDAAQDGQPLPAVTGITGGKIETLKNISATSHDAAWLQNPKVREQLFGEKALTDNKNAYPVEYEPQKTVFFTVTHREKPQPRPFAEVKADIEREYRNAGAEKGLQARGDALQKALAENSRDKTDELAREYGVETRTIEPTNRFSDNPIVPALFEKPERITSHKSANGDLVIARLDSVRDGDIKTLPENIRQGSSYEWQMHDTAATYGSYSVWLYRHAKIKVYEEQLQH